VLLGGLGEVRGVRLATDEDVFLCRDDLVEVDVYLVRALGAAFDGLFFGVLLVGAVLDGLVDGHHGFPGLLVLTERSV
jgi:hypothetical protein